MTEFSLDALIQEEGARRQGADNFESLLQEEDSRRGLATPLPPPEMQGTGDPFEDVETLHPSIDRILIKAADAGVEYDRPAPGGHFLASLAYDEENRLMAFQKTLSEKFGGDAELRIGPETGQLEYMNPETGRFSLVNPPGASIEDIEGIGGAAMVIGAETFGGVLGAVLGKHPYVIAMGAGAGAFLGELTRLHLGRKMGINENVTDEQIIMSAIKEGGISATLGIAGEKFVAFGRFVLDVIQGKPLAEKLLRSLDISAEEAFELQRQINDKIGSAEFAFNLAQATQDEDILVLTEVLRKSAEFGKDFGAVETAQRNALRTFYETINKPYNSRLTTPEAGRRVQEVASGQVEKELQRQDIFVNMKNRDLDVALGNIPTNPYEDLGRSIRGFADPEYQAFRAWASDAATSLHELAGGKAFIPNENLHKVISRMSGEMQEALFPKTQAGTKGLLGDMFETVDGKKTLRAIFDPDAKFTFKQAWDAVSELKRIERTAAMGLSTEEPAVAAVRQLYGSLEKDMRHAMQNSPLREQYDVFIKRYAAEKTRLDRGIIGEVMTKDLRNEGFVVANDDVFRQVFSGRREAEELHALVRDSPDMMQGMREAIGDFYKRTVVVDGRVNLARHNAFLERYGNQARVFFSKDEMRLLSKPGNIEKVLQAREKARDRAVQEINGSFEAQIANLNNPGKLISLIMDPKNPDKARHLMQILEKTPDARRAVQNEFRKVLEERTAGQFKNGERFFSPAKFDEFLNGKGGEGGFKSVARNIFGDQYVADLDLLNQVFKRVSAEPRFPNRSNTSFWMDTVKNVSRAYVGLFTRPGRFITALDRIRGRAANRLLARVINDPSKLREFMALRGTDMRDRKVRTFVMSVGGSALLQDYN